MNRKSQIKQLHADFRRGKMLGSGCMFLLFAIIGAKGIIMKSPWRAVPAEIVAVELQCAMEPTSPVVVDGNVGRVTIPCGEIAAFKAMHAGQNWAMHPTYALKLRIGAGAGTVQTLISIEGIHGHSPEVGDVLTVIPDPANPAAVEILDDVGVEVGIVSMAAGIGSLLLFFGLRRRRPAASAVSRQPATGPAATALATARSAPTQSGYGFRKRLAGDPPEPGLRVMIPPRKPR